MVYQGVPSRACKPCRSRKLKCDETRPACKRCVRTGRTCEGYPDALDILFRNETDIVKKRATKAEQKTSTLTNRTVTRAPTVRKIKCLPESTDAILMPRLPSNSSYWSIPATLKPSTEDEAVAFFLTNYIRLPRPKSEQRGYLAAVGDVWPKTSISSALYHAVTATSMAALAKYPSRRHIRDQAVMSYGQALKKLAAAMNDPVQAKQNETLLTCLILAFYELIDGSSNSIFGYAKHIDGAAALVRLRGTEQFRDPAARNIYRGIRNQAILLSIQGADRLEEFPPEVIGPDEGIEELMHHKLSLLAQQIPNLRADANDLLDGLRLESNTDKVLDLLDSVQELDLELATWYDSVPHSFLPKVVATYDPSPDDEEQDIINSEIYPGPVMHYKTIHQANLLNQYRSCRLFLQAMIGRIIIWTNAPLSSFKSDPRYIQAYLTICSLVNDVCASVPYMLGYQLGGTIGKTSNQELDQAANAAGAVMLVWPLFVARSVECIPKQQRDWINGRLRHVASEFGLGQAGTLSKVKPALVRGLKVFLGKSLQYVPADSEPATLKNSTDPYA